MANPKILIGTCSWNYPSWKGLVYSHTCKKSADYLVEYSKRFRTAEIDSWFYRMPQKKDVLDYKAAVDSEFVFTCKVPQALTVTHLRQEDLSHQLLPNAQFLDVSLFKAFLEAIEPLLPQMQGIMFEFEYLNKSKMPSLSIFLNRFASFIANIPTDLPIAIEVRNGEWLNQEYFSFLRAHSLIHVFSQKQYMPPVYNVYAKHADLLGSHSIIRLMGGNRAEIEALTNNTWNAIVQEQPDKDKVLAMLVDMMKREKSIILSTNNHYEGSAPLTNSWFEAELAKHS